MPKPFSAGEQKESSPGIPPLFTILFCISIVLAQPGAGLAGATAGPKSPSPTGNKEAGLSLEVSGAPTTPLAGSEGRAISAPASPGTLAHASPGLAPSDSTAETSNHAFPHASLGRCILFSATLCRAVHDKPVLALTALQAGLLVSDGITTRQVIHRGYFEIDPVARIFIGTRPTWGRMAPIGAAQAIAGTWLAERMRTSRHIWIRRFWLAPQMAGIAGNAWATGHNLSLLR